MLAVVAVVAVVDMFECGGCGVVAVVQDLMTTCPELVAARAKVTELMRGTTHTSSTGAAYCVCKCNRYRTPMAF